MTTPSWKNKRTMSLSRRKGTLGKLASMGLLRRRTLTLAAAILCFGLLVAFNYYALLSATTTASSSSLRSNPGVSSAALAAFSEPPRPALRDPQRPTEDEKQALDGWAAAPMVGSFRYSPTSRIHLPWTDLAGVLREPVVGARTWPSMAANGLPPAIATNTTTTTTKAWSTSEHAVLTRKGRKPSRNQDRIGIVSYDDAEDDWWMGLFDGHGDLGHVHAQSALYGFPKLLSEIRPHHKTTTGEELMKAVSGVFREVQAGLPRVLGGCTGISIWKRGKDLLLSSVGDSSAAVFSMSPVRPDGTWEIKLIHKIQPHKPDNPGERQRIEAAGGTVQDPPMPGLTARLLIPIPSVPGMVNGLAMSRALGDFDGERVGLSHVPDHTLVRLDTYSKENSYFVVLASDGIWDELNTMLVGKAFAVSSLMQPDLQPALPGPLQLIEQLIVLASEHWKDKNLMDGYRDDISMAVHKLHLP